MITRKNGSVLRSCQGEVTEQSLSTLAIKCKREDNPLKIEKNKRDLLYFVVKLVKENQLHWIHVFLLSESPYVLFKSS